MAESKKVQPHIPIPFRVTNKILDTYSKVENCGEGLTAKVTYVKYKDKKGNIHDHLMFVKWL